MASIPPPKNNAGIDAFSDMIENMGAGCRGLGQTLAEMIGVPYQEGRESDAFLGHRPKDTPREEALAKGPLLPRRLFRRGDETIDIEGFPPASETWELLTEEVWDKDNWPDSFNEPVEAVNKLRDGVAALYYHRPSMNLVLVGPGGEKVGIRSTALAKPMQGLNHDAVQVLTNLRRAVSPWS